MQYDDDDQFIEVDNPQDSPWHAAIVFRKKGEIVRGIVTDAEIIDLMDEIFHRLKYVTI